MSTAAGVSSSFSSKKRKSSSSGEKHPAKSTQSPAKSRPRVFSDDDSLNLLKTFHEILKDSPSPSTAATLLFNRIGKSLSGEISQTQMIEKLRKLRQKYSKQAEEKSEFKTPYEKELFEISNKIWGENPSKRNTTGSSTPKKAARRGANGKKKEEPKTQTPTSDVEKAVVAPVAPVAVIPEAKVDLSKKYSFLMEEVAQFPENIGIREGLKLLDESQLGRLNNGWKLQQIKEAEMLVKRTELIQEQTKLVLEALAPSIPN